MASHLALDGWGRFADPRRARRLIAIVAFAAYLPSLAGGFIFDDERFILANTVVKELTWSGAARFFTDPSSQSTVGHDIYRPLRSLDFAIDWAIGGGSPRVFRLHSMVLHVVACLLLYAVLRQLLDPGEEGGAASLGPLFGTLLFALHPVHTESVAWIASRSDLLLLVFFLLALWLYLRDRPAWALLAFVGALLSKETAVFFPAACLLVDLLRRADQRRIRRWLWYGAYGALSLAYVVLWVELVAKGKVEDVRHLAGQTWGGSYPMTLLTMAKGFAHYLRVMVLPVHFTVDYHVPTSTGLHLMEALCIAVLATVVVLAVRAGLRARFALAWFFLAMLPVSNLIRPIGIPTAERFLYLPMAGVALWAGPVLARHRRVAWALLACLFVLTFTRTRTWNSAESLWIAAEDVADVPRGLAYFAGKNLHEAHQIRQRIPGAPPSERPALREQMLDHARATVRYSDKVYDLYENVIRLRPPAGAAKTRSDKANALILLDRPEEALVAAREAIRDWDHPLAYFNQALALQALQRWKEAAESLTIARNKGYDKSDLRPGIADFWLRAGAVHERAGEKEEALASYREAWAALPDPELNPQAQEAIRRLSG